MTTIEDRARAVLVAYQVRKAALLDRIVADESGEGVISAAIAVLVMAFLGAAMWIAFKTIFDGASDKVEANVNDIGT